jgi:poly-gamma-glutamate synthesis protein (capsule biosynthesis protein)
MEIYRGRLILYGCGDFLNDYEGIAGYEDYRGDLAPMYFADFEPTGSKLIGLTIVPLRIKTLRLVWPSRQDVVWMREALDRESRPFGLRATLDADGRIAIVRS